MSHRKFMTAVGACVLIAAPAVAASTGTSHALLFQVKGHRITCGVELQVLAHNTVLCSARGVPRPAHGGPAGDPFVQITKTGKPQLVLISEDAYHNVTAVKLAKGATWSKDGVTCKVKSKTLTCTNTSGHGFTLGNDKYKKF